MKISLQQLEEISEEGLLKIRLCDLPLHIENTWLKECIDQLYHELDQAGIVFKPSLYLADEWLTPYKEICIGIPFYLAHPRLIKLEKKIMIEAEGEGESACMKLLRHEAGHAISHAYGFYKRKKWQKLFGPSSLEYSSRYKYRPYSKNYVCHLDGFYAQYHPDEDFVETFAVWLTPDSCWREKYQGWKALEKLNYVDQLMQAIKGKKPLRQSQRQYWRLSTLRMSLKNYYKKKRHFWAEEFPDFHDIFLSTIFVQASSEGPKYSLAATIIQKYRRFLIDHVARCSGEKKHVINDLLGDIIKRSRELKMIAQTEEPAVILPLSCYVTSLIMNYLYTGQFRLAKKNIHTYEKKT